MKKEAQKDRRPSILCVEDDVITLNAMKNLLIDGLENRSTYGEVYTAHNGLEGWRLYEKIRPGILLTDIRMPGMNGMELARKVMNDGSNTQIIVLSAYGETDYLLEAINCGIHFFIIKPISTDKIKVVIQDAVRQYISEWVYREQTEKLRLAATELTLAEEKERRKFAAQLHDHIGQNLALSLIQLEMLRRKANPGEQADPLWGQLKSTIDSCIQSSRTLTFELSPPVLYELGLEEALKWYADYLEKNYPVRVGVICQGMEILKENEDIRVFLYRSVREIMINAVKHSGGTNIMVSGSCRDNILNISVSDDGQGFDSQALEGGGITKSGFGLFSIRERLSYLGGNIRIESAEGKGAKVTLSLSVRPKGEVPDEN